MTASRSISRRSADGTGARRACRPASIRFAVVPWIALWMVLSMAGAGAVFADRDTLGGAVAVDRTEDERLEIVLPALDEHAIRQADERRAAAGRVAHFAAPRPVDLEPWTHGVWEAVDDERARWRLRLRSAGALSLSLAFDRFAPTPGTRLWVTGDDPEDRVGPLTAASSTRSTLWTPPVDGDVITLELTVPMDELERLDVHVARVHHGYAGFGERIKSGPCHPHAACAESEPWTEASRGVGLLIVDGVRYCTGFLVNNTARDRRPLLATARHCGLDRSTAESLVVLWDRRRESCDAGDEQHEGDASGSSTDPPSFQSGASLRAAVPGVDLVLVELDAPAPRDATFLGWDRSDDDPRRAAALHHPNTDLLRVAVTEDLRTTRHLRDRAMRGADHLRTTWSVGSTEGGSSGAPLVDELGRAVGLLRGGYAACGDRGADWFARLSAAWDLGEEPARRLRDWLDPLGTQTLVLDPLVGGEPAAEAPRRTELSASTARNAAAPRPSTLAGPPPRARADAPRSLERQPAIFR